MSALGRKQPFTALSSEWPLSGVKRLFKSLDFRKLNGRYRPKGVIRQIKKPRRMAGVI
jgi:hypothetical protein